MSLTAKDQEALNTALFSIQAELEVHKTLLFCFLVNMMAASGRMELLDELVEQARFLVNERQPKGMSAEEVESRRKWTLEAFDRVLDALYQARAAMERVGRPEVN